MVKTRKSTPWLDLVKSSLIKIKESGETGKDVLKKAMIMAKKSYKKVKNVTMKRGGKLADGEDEQGEEVEEVASGEQGEEVASGEQYASVAQVVDEPVKEGQEPVASQGGKKSKKQNQQGGKTSKKQNQQGGKKSKKQNQQGGKSKKQNQH